MDFQNLGQYEKFIEDFTLLLLLLHTGDVGEYGFMMVLFGKNVILENAV